MKLKIIYELMKNIYLFIVLAVFLYSCQSKVIERTEIVEFPMNLKINPSVILTDSVILAPDAMFVMNDQIWILQRKMDPLFYVFDIQTCNFLFSTGTKGQGPDDFIFPRGLTIQSENDFFTILDVGKGNIVKTMEWIPNYGLRTLKSEVPFSDGNPLNGFIKLSDSLFCAFADCFTGTVGNLEYKIMNTLDRKEFKFSKYPENIVRKKLEQDMKCQIYGKNLIANSEKKRFAAFYNYFKFFRIYSYEGELINETYVNIPPYQTKNIENWEARLIYYGKPEASDQYIYAYCSANKEIQVWDWDGNPIINYMLMNDKIYSKFTVSEKLKTIYLLSYDEDDLDKIFTFELTHLN